MQGPDCGFAVFIWTCTPFTVMLLHQAGTDVWPPIRPSYPDQMHIMGAYVACGMESLLLAFCNTLLPLPQGGGSRPPYTHVSCKGVCAASWHWQGSVSSLDGIMVS